MLAISIHQPYASLIMLPDSHPRAKRVENRVWAPSMVGHRIAVHASKTTRRLHLAELYGLAEDSLPLGVLLGTVELVDCFDARSPLSTSGAVTKRSWLATHEHVEGPICWVLEKPRLLKKPVPWRGAQGWFNVPGELFEKAVPC